MSLSRRLLLIASLTLFVILGITGLVLERAFSRSAEEAVQTRLQIQVYALLAAASFEVQAQQLQIEEPLPDPRLSSPQSHIHAVIYSAAGQTIWRSPSSVGERLPQYLSAEMADWFFERLFNGQTEDYFSLNTMAAWEDDQGQQHRYVFQVLEDRSVYDRQVSQFRRELWSWLAGVTIVFLIVQALVLRRGLKPLRDVSTDLDRVKAGDVGHLNDDYPTEIRHLTVSLNTFIDSERAQRDRYRQTLSDLAHSLKTPLTVIRSGLEKVAQPDELQEQVDRMRQIIDYQLQRASASGRVTLGKSVALNPSIQRIVDSLQKVHRDRDIDCQLQLSDHAVFPGEQGDLLELLGNLLENAFKWARHQVLVTASMEDSGQHLRLKLRVEDDGPGIPQAQRQAVMRRGQRADESVDGHGIGLSIVSDIVSVYGGDIQINDSERLGGAALTITLPLS